ncbi:exocyst complex component Sec3-domain-containing protein [Kalaharituber pfeilii]|nr:exocyst complex component Sec3-domain-containing protein [Kalaharituber pfeilii]
MPEAGPGQTGALTKAQKFEDEKRRIISSCFSKVDADGALLESYITHCRVVEDAMYPSQPPPLDAHLDQKKARVILVAVRKSGRVRVHKARENQNGTYSIGKSWYLDDLQQIENHPAPHDKGFTVTIVKPYFWQANSLKEKEFFIQSLLKIFKKYTGGKVPNLIGFEGTEIGQIAEGAVTTGSTASSIRTSGNQTQQRNVDSPTPPPQAPASQQLSQSPGAGYAAKEATSRPLRSQQSTPSIRTREEHMAPSQTSSLRPMQSAVNLSSRRPQDQVKTISQDSTNSTPLAANERRRPSDSSTRSATNASNNLRTESAASARQSSQDDERSIKTAASSIEQASVPEQVTPMPAQQQKPKEPPPPIVPPASRSSNRELSPQTPTPPPMPQDSDKGAKPGKKKSTGDIANRFRLAATTYSAGGLLGKNKSPTITTPRTPTFNLAGQDGAKGKGDIGRSIKDMISGPIIEPPPRSDTRSSLDQQRSSQSPDEGTPTVSFETFTNSNDVDNDRQSRASEDLERGLHRRSMSPTLRQRKHRVAKESVLDEIDTSQLTFNVDKVLKEFNWDWRGKVDILESDIRKELVAVEAKNVLINPGGDERLEELSKLFDEAIEQCENLDGLLTLYAVELTSLTDDIAHIENQSQGLQVQTANQKSLQKELERILSTISISPSQLEVLKQGSLETGLGAIEMALLALYKAMLTIDPSISTSNRHEISNFDDENVGSIRALQERKEGYRLESKEFLRRFRQFMNIKFQAEIVGLQKVMREQDAVGQAGRQSHNPQKPRLVGHDELYKNLYKFAGLILFAKEVDKEEFTELQKLYERPTRALYQEELRDHIFAWKRITRKVTAEESELVFTTQEKESERLTTTVRTLTVKRSQTLAKSLRSPSSMEFSKDGSKKDSQEGKIYPHEALSGALEEIFRQVCREQNFVIEFFHLHSQTNVPYEEFAQSGAPESRTVRDLGLRRTVDQDRMLGRMVLEYIGEVFSFLLTDLGNFVDWAIKSDPLQGVGVLFSLEKYIRLLDETNQEFLLKTLQKLHDRLRGLFSKFLDEQVRAIEETKVKIKKRKGVIAFMKTFPQFAARIEDQLPPGTLDIDIDSTQPLEIRAMVDRGYKMINKAMFESLQAIAKESGFGMPGAMNPAAMAISGPSVHVGGADPEDKEQLNYHIMMIENMNHYVEDVDTRGNLILGDFMRRAEIEYKEHLGLYVAAVVRRPLGKLLDFIESIESQLTSSSSLAIEDIAGRASHSRHVLKKILSHYDSKEIRRGIETLRKRVDKHFAEGDEQNTSRRLLLKMNRELMEEYMNIRERITSIIAGAGNAYLGLELEFSREDVVQGFTK